MNMLDWAGLKSRGRHLAAAAPALVAALGVAMAAGSTTRSDDDRRAEAVARATGGDFSSIGLGALLARFDPAQRALAERHDPGAPRVTFGLTPGWESLTLAGKPILELGASGLDARKRNAAMPSATGALQPARPFVFKAATETDRRRALRCLSQAIYYEAALESTPGQEAVAQVILNRVRDPNYPDSICGVVFQGAERTTGCQFSFTCDGALSQPPVTWAWDRASKVAERVLAGHVAARVGTATHYHADYVFPWWSPTLAKIDQIGAHIFYRWKGAYGETAAFRQTYAGREPVIDEARFSKPRLTLVSLDETLPETVDRDATMRTVEIDGQTRVVGIASLGGRRQPTATDIAAINERLRAFEDPPATAPVETVAPVQGAVPMDVEEVGRPAS